MKVFSVLVVLCASALVAIAFSSASQQSVAGPVPVHLAPLDSQLMTLGAMFSHEYEVVGEAENVAVNGGVDVRTGELTLYWAFGKDGPHFFSPPLDELTSHYSIAFPVTAMSFTNDGKLLVAGMNKTNGRTHVERWSFANPRVKRSGAKVELLAGRVIERKVLFEESSSANLDFITWIWCSPAMGDDDFLFMTYPGYGLYSMDVSEAIAGQVLSVDASIGGLAPVPDLSLDWQGGSVLGNHVDYGWCYEFGNRRPGESHIDGLKSIVFHDSNRDGDIDGVFYVPTTGSESLNLGATSGVWIH